MDYLFIVNPMAGVGSRRSFPNMILKGCSKYGVNGVVLFTRCAGDAQAIINEHFDQYDCFVAVGGDGTMNEVASALAGTGKTMALIPCGSGNALGRELGLSMKPAEALKQILEGEEISIDTGIVNGKRFINVCGLGFDNYIARQYAKGTRRGPVPYFLSVAREFSGFKPSVYKIKAEGMELQEKVFVLTVANASQYGNNAYIAPSASLNDGLLDLCIMRPYPVLAAPGMAIRLLKGTLENSSYCTYYKVKNVEIEGENLDYHVDGEPIDNRDRIEISIDPGSLKIIAPKRN